MTYVSDPRSSRTPDCREHRQRMLAGGGGSPIGCMSAGVSLAGTGLAAVAGRLGTGQLPDLTRRTYALLLSAMAAISLGFQLLLYHQGLLTVSLDESERTLMAYRLTLARAFEPAVWPPLPRAITGLALALHGDLVTTPRIVVGATGLLTLGAAVLLTRQLFDNRAIAVVAGLLSVVVPQRLILSVAPMADIFAYLFILLAAAFLIDWLRSGRLRPLINASIFLLLAAMTRNEVWLFNGVLVLYLAYRSFVRRDLRMRRLAASGALLVAFPIIWVAATYINDGSLATFSLTRRQFMAAHGQDLQLAVHNNAAFLFLRDGAVSPAVLVGALALLLLAVRHGDIRTWMLLLFIPLGLLSVGMLATFSVPTAAPFRTDGVWVLLVMPFAAWAVVSIAQLVPATSYRRLAAVALLVLACVVPTALRARAVAHDAEGQTGALADTALARELRSVLHASKQRILLDSSQTFDYLNVLVLSNAPDRFVLNVNVAPTDPAAQVQQLPDRFGLAGHLSMRAIRARRIGYLLVRNKTFIKALADNPVVVATRRFGPWQLFRVREQTA